MLAELMEEYCPRAYTCEKLYNLLVPVREGQQAPPGTCDNSKMQLSLQHDQEAPCGQSLSDS